MTWRPGEGDDRVPYVNGFLVWRDGSIYVGTQGSSVRKFASDGRFLLTTRPRLDRVSRFAVDSKGCIYVVHGGMLNLISKFDPRGVLLSDDPREARAVAERLTFDRNGNLVNRETGNLVDTETLNFADRVIVECMNSQIKTFFFGDITIDNQDRLHVLIDERNPYAAGSAIFDTEGYLVGVGPGGWIRFDRAGRRYVFQGTGDWGQAAALTMYSPSQALLPGPLMLPADKIVVPRVAGALAGISTEGAFVEGSPPLDGWSVDDSGNFYCCGSSKREVPTELSPGRVIYVDLYVYKLDPSGHVLARSPAMPYTPDEGGRYEPQIDGQGRIYYLEFYPDRVEVMRGTFAP